MIRLLILSAMFLLNQSCGAQRPEEIDAGGPCEGCEAVLEYGEKELDSRDTIPGYEEEQAKLHISGTVYEADGKTPAENIVVYIHHTDREGFYTPAENASGWGKRHGKHRGWIKTGKDGSYNFYTFRPAHYPDRKSPQHIHVYIKEPGISPYYIDDILFTDDPKLTSKMINDRPRRGGNGVVTPKSEDSILQVERDIYLGRNIPGYPSD